MRGHFCNIQLVECWAVSKSQPRTCWWTASYKWYLESSGIGKGLGRNCWCWTEWTEWLSTKLWLEHHDLQACAKDIQANVIIMIHELISKPCNAAPFVLPNRIPKVKELSHVNKEASTHCHNALWLQMWKYLVQPSCRQKEERRICKSVIKMESV